MRSALAAVAALAGVPAAAQADRCVPPREVARPRPEGPSVREPARIVPIRGYTLAMSWQPQYCRTRGPGGANDFACGPDSRFGFTLHGLWPDGAAEGRWPQYCVVAPVLDRATIRRNLCTTPSAQLLQHEYAKHGTCTGLSADRYFAQARGHFERLRFPDMGALSRRPGLTAGAFAAAVARANPGITPPMLRVRASRDGWLEELWLCLNGRERPAACPRHQRGLTAARPLRIWRGRAA